jgi:hypothetical protein
MPVPPENPYAARDSDLLNIIALLGIQIAFEAEASSEK